MSTSILAQTALHLYGGKNHDVYLGCLNSDKFDANSIWNEYTYGSKYNQNSIWNDSGIYGSKFSTYCPWDPSSNYPPVVLDKERRFYGYFTVNKYQDERAEFQLALTIYEFHDLMRDNVGKWYSKLFK